MQSTILRRLRLSRTDYFSFGAGEAWHFETLVGHDGVRYFSHARNALAQGFHAIGVGPGDNILLPGFICRDLLSSIHAVGANPVFYPVERNMEPGALDSLAPAKAIIAVNYFGFPQNLAPFRSYCLRSGATLVEDNAHGLFSRDAAGQLLGTRGDIGIFSLRKTIPLPDGAALVSNTTQFRSKLSPQLAGRRLPLISVAAIKRCISSPHLHLPPASRRFLKIARRLERKLRTGHALPISTSESEYFLPAAPAPYAGLLRELRGVDIARESGRRKDLYLRIAEWLTNRGFELLFRTLPEGTVPYAVPFYASYADAACLSKDLARLTLDCVPWPDLPESQLGDAPDHYRSVWIVGLLW
jgi:hypothetical protein